MNGARVIQTNALSKSYDGVQAVRNLNLALEANRITGFLGRNGAGKSTTIKMLLGLIRPTEGGGTVLGSQITDREENRKTRQRVAYVAENKPLYPLHDRRADDPLHGFVLSGLAARDFEKTRPGI
jgi:ABC-2 type transport system ATP-binding protein